MLGSFSFRPHGAAPWSYVVGATHFHIGRLQTAGHFTKRGLDADSNLADADGEMGVRSTGFSESSSISVHT